MAEKENKEVEVEELTSSSTEPKPKKSTKKNAEEKTKENEQLEKVVEEGPVEETEKKYRITSNVLGFGEEYYTLIKPTIKTKVSNTKRYEFLKKLESFGLVKEI